LNEIEGGIGIRRDANVSKYAELDASLLMPINNIDGEQLGIFDTQKPIDQEFSMIGHSPLIIPKTPEKKKTLPTTDHHKCHTMGRPKAVRESELFQKF
jgi:hypothetical protein